MSGVTSTMAGLASRWIFTHNNYSDSDLEIARNWITADNCLYGVVGKEIAETTNTPHLQGFVHLKRNRRVRGLKKCLFNAHFEVARGTDEENQKYCKKGGDVLLEVGKPQPKSGTNRSFVNATEIAEKVGGGEDLYDVLCSQKEKYLVAFDKHMKYIDRMTQIIRNRKGEEAFVQYYGANNVVFWPWLRTDTPWPWAYDMDMQGRLIDVFNIEKMPNMKMKLLPPVTFLRMRLRPRWREQRLHATVNSQDVQLDTYTFIPKVDNPWMDTNVLAINAGQAPDLNASNGYAVSIRNANKRTMVVYQKFYVLFRGRSNNQTYTDA